MCCDQVFEHRRRQGFFDIIRSAELLDKVGVKHYGIAGDALNPVIDALRRNGKIEFIHVRHEEYGLFAAVADAYLTGNFVVVCGTTRPELTHLLNGLMDARKRCAPIIAIAGDGEARLIDTAALEELNGYKCFETACLYASRVVNPEQVRAVVTTAILTSVDERGRRRSHCLETSHRETRQTIPLTRWRFSLHRCFGKA